MQTAARQHGDWDLPCVTRRDHDHLPRFWRCHLTISTKHTVYVYFVSRTQILQEDWRRPLADVRRGNTVAGELSIGRHGWGVSQRDKRGSAHGYATRLSLLADWISNRGKKITRGSLACIGIWPLAVRCRDDGYLNERCCLCGWNWWHRVVDTWDHQGDVEGAKNIRRENAHDKTISSRSVLRST